MSVIKSILKVMMLPGHFATFCVCAFQHEMVGSTLDDDGNGKVSALKKELKLRAVPSRAKSSILARRFTGREWRLNAHNVPGKTRRGLCHGEEVFPSKVPVDKPAYR